jgi:hypothetical protein
MEAIQNKGPVELLGTERLEKLKALSK